MTKSTWAAIALSFAAAGALVSAWLVTRARSPGVRARGPLAEDAAAILRMEGEGGPSAPPTKA